MHSVYRHGTARVYRHGTARANFIRALTTNMRRPSTDKIVAGTNFSCVVPIN